MLLPHLLSPLVEMSYFGFINGIKQERRSLRAMWFGMLSMLTSFNMEKLRPNKVKWLGQLAKRSPSPEPPLFIQLHTNGCISFFPSPANTLLILFLVNMLGVKTVQSNWSLPSRLSFHEVPISALVSLYLVSLYLVR